MNKLTYTYTNVPKQLLFYICAFYLVLRSIMDIQIVLYQVEGYADQINLPLELTVNALFFAFWLLLSNGHKLCYTEFNSEKAIYHNRLLRSKKEFLFENARAVFFDKRGIRFFARKEDASDKRKALFFIPFFRDGKINVLEHKRFYDLLKEREAAIGDAERFVVYRSYKEVPGYSRKWKYVSFAYACLDVLLGLNCFTPIAVILGLMEAFR